MMIKITERCSMGCKHCMNSSTCDGKDMDMHTLHDCLMFFKNNNLCKEHLIINGGEPTEHPHFDTIIKSIISFGKKEGMFSVLTVTTNGEIIQNEPERFLEYVKIAKEAGIILMFQVSADVRYYPRRINVHKRIFREPGFVLIDDCIRQIYPQGRAKENNLPWKALASKCFNVRALSHQFEESATLHDIEKLLLQKQKFCTPHISVEGDIKLGESDLCPSCASIYDDMATIMHKIRSFQCSYCDHINDYLPVLHQHLLIGK